MCAGRSCVGPGGCVTRALMASHVVDSPMAARAPGGLAAARIQESALAGSIPVAATADPVADRRWDITNYATLDFPAAPWRVVGPISPDLVNLDFQDTPTRTDSLNDLLGGAVDV